MKRLDSKNNSQNLIFAKNHLSIKHTILQIITFQYNIKYYHIF